MPTITPNTGAGSFGNISPLLLQNFNIVPNASTLLINGLFPTVFIFIPLMFPGTANVVIIGQQPQPSIFIQNVPVSPIESPAPNNYPALITSEHASKPNFSAWITALTQAFADAQEEAGGFPSLFSVDTAVGDQLDSVAQWIGGVTRFVPVPIAGVYFAFDIAGVGFDQGVWRLPTDPVEGISRLGDELFRLALKTQIGLNNWDGSLAGMQQIIQGLFSTGSGIQTLVSDNFNMSMLVSFAGQSPPPVLLTLLTGGFLQIRPAAVRIAISTSIGPSFGFDEETSAIQGFDQGSWAIFQ